MKRKYEIPERIKKAAVRDCLTVEQFALKYYKPDRFTRQGSEYMEAVLHSKRRDLQERGYTQITHHDSVTGETAYFITPDLSGENLHFVLTVELTVNTNSGETQTAWALLKQQPVFMNTEDFTIIQTLITMVDTKK